MNSTKLLGVDVGFNSVSRRARLSQLAEGDDLDDGPGHMDAAHIGALTGSEVYSKTGLAILSGQATDWIVGDVVIAANCPKATLKAVELS